MLTVLRFETSRVPTSQCFLATGRSCLAHLITRYGPHRVVMPYMVPEGLVEPFEKAGVPVAHYTLHTDLSPNLFDLQNVVRRSVVGRQLVVVIHYCGYAMPTAEAATIAHEAGGLLLADSAHCGLNPDPETDCADLCLYSFNKILPVVDGAVLLSRSHHADVGYKGDLNPLDEKIVSAYWDHMAANRIVAMLSGGTLFDTAMKHSDACYAEYYNGIRDMLPRKPSTGHSFAVRDTVCAVVAKRKDNASIIDAQLKKRHVYRRGAPAFAVPVRTVCRYEALAILREAGISAGFFGKLWRAPQVTAPEHDFWINHVLLPVSESLTAKQVTHIADTVEFIP